MNADQEIRMRAVESLSARGVMEIKRILEDARQIETYVRGADKPIAAPKTSGKTEAKKAA